MITPQISSSWESNFPGGHMGFLLMGSIDNTRPADALQAHQQQLTLQLRGRHGESDRAKLRQHPVLLAYKNYYRQFNKTYHVLLQLESIVHKGKSLPRVNPLVDAVFAAEMEKLILTAGHDADQLVPPVTIAASDGSEHLLQLSGQQVDLKANDMIMTDGQGVVCAVLYGQDQRTQITPATRRVLYVAYAPHGIQRTWVSEHLETIERNVRMFAPEALVEYRQVHSAPLKTV